MTINKRNNSSFCVVLFLGLIMCFSCDDKDNATISHDEIINLTVLDKNNLQVSEIAGDGETLIKLQAKIPSKADPKYKKITFKASKGQFLSSTSNTTYEKAVDANGMAEVYLKLPLEHGPLFLSAEIGTDSDKYIAEKRITLLNVGQIINLEILDQNTNPITADIKADGTTIVTVKATVNFNSDAIGSIRFITSAGTFSGISIDNNIVAINNNVATIQLKLPKSIGVIYLRAEAATNSNIFKNVNLSLTRAFADNIILEPSVLSIDSKDDLVTINTYLTRNIGSVSIGTTAQYKAFQLDTNNNEVEVGRFSGLLEGYTNDNSQISSVKFVPDTGDIDFAKPIIIKVSTRNDNNQEILRSFILNK
ncbi:hypothetical protein [Flavobacterium sp. FlaQc-48]|uniref:hypothetical protein n=1 Tax=Flavobacterium sp. FlaQc-48 TaxID=3374181 RepID=UPI0037582642